MQRLTRLLLVLAVAAPVTATPLLCMWDYDTLLQERARFPETLELITGKFPRHSDAFYRWRIDDREAKRDSAPDDPRILDDLAVAWSKLGDHAKAIELMEEKETRFPGLYETAANLGTFHIHAGDLEEGAKYIERAIEMNPDAHFGRERYQLELVRYVLSKRAESEEFSLPLHHGPVGPLSGGRSNGFWDALAPEGDVEKEVRTEQIHSAIKGVLGMMRFGNYDSPILCEALADLLMADWNSDAKNLAARALLQASYKVENEQSSAVYRRKAERALSMQTPDGRSARSVKLAEVEPLFAAELADAKEWCDQVEKDELQWIADGEDVEARFAEKYFGAEPSVKTAGGWMTPGRDQLFLGLGATILALVLVRRRFRLAAAKAAV